MKEVMVCKGFSLLSIWSLAGGPETLIVGIVIGCFLDKFRQYLFKKFPSTKP